MGTVIAKFSTSDKEYAYFVPEADIPQVGDMLLTSVISSQVNDEADLNYQTLVTDARWARVVRVDSTPDPRATRFYMYLVPLDELRLQHKANKEYLKAQADKAEARRLLDELLREEDRMSDYERLATKSTEAAALLAKIKG